LPAFYFNEREDYTFDVIDGLHRLSALYEFVMQPESFPLKSLEYLRQFNGCEFSELPVRFQRRIEESEISVYIIRAGTHPDIIRSLFLRLNTTAKSLNPQEIRHILYMGVTTEFLHKFVRSDIFQMIIDIPDKRLAHEELALRFVSFYLLGYQNYRHSYQDFLDIGIKKLDNLLEQEYEKCEIMLRKFENALELLNRLFGRHAFNKRFPIGKSNQKYSFNKPLFEIWTVSLANLNKGQHFQLIRKKNQLIRIFSETLEYDQRFLDSISLRSSRRSVITRFSTIEHILKEVLK